MTPNSSNICEIAIVGAAFKLPNGCRRFDDLFNRLMVGEDFISSVPEQRFNQEDFFHPNRATKGRSYTFDAGIVDDILEFDANFFGISAREAEQMDPQQRLLLMLTFEALQDGAQRMKDWGGGDAGVFVGISSKDYADVRQIDPELSDPFTMLGSTLSIAANRISYAFDLHGPSMAIDTACSSALVAMHQACMAIWTGQLDSAIVGASQALMSPVPFVGFSQASMLADYGRCRSFGNDGRGYVRAEGGGVVVLKRLEDALAADDPIRAVIRASGVNTDGRTRGLALPSAHWQAALLREVYQKFDVDPGAVAYCEAHGTGTAVGDPAEALSIGETLGRAESRVAVLPIGSIKSSIGHLESAAGMAGLMKCLAILEKGVIPPTRMEGDLNPDIDFEGLGLKVIREPEDLGAASSGSTLIGVNSFGFGGANAHLVIESSRRAREELSTAAESGWPTLEIGVSAMTADALRQYAKDLSDIVDWRNPDVATRAASTLAHRRDHLAIRAAVQAKRPEEVFDGLREIASGRTELPAPISGDSERSIAFIFSGNGSQWSGMGSALMRQDPRFQAEVAKIDKVFSGHIDFSIADTLNNPCEGDMADTRVAQACLFTVQIALVRVLAKEGVTPSSVAGHSVGEIAAAYAAGALTLENAVKVIVHRSEAQHLTRGLGKMLAVRQSADQLKDILNRFGEEVEVAAYNSPNSVTLAGTERAILSIANILVDQKIQNSVLDLDYVFHSQFMDPVEEKLKSWLSGISSSPPVLPFISTVTGGEIGRGVQLDGDYWWRNVRQSVKFEDAVRMLIESDIGGAVEIGPHPILLGYCAEIARDLNCDFPVVATMRRTHEQLDLVRGVRCAAWQQGLAIDWKKLVPDVGLPCRLPAYPWELETYALPPSPNAEGRYFSIPEGALLGTRTASNETVFQRLLDTAVEPFVTHHKVGGVAVFPAAGMIEMALEAAQTLKSTEFIRLEDFDIAAPMVLDEGQSTQARCQIEPGTGVFELTARGHGTGDEWRRIATCRVAGGLVHGLRFQDFRPPAGSPTSDKDEHYAITAMLGLDYGPLFQSVQSIWAREDTTWVRLKSAEEMNSRGFVLDPALLDGALQAVLHAASHHTNDGSQESFLPVKFSRLTVRANVSPAWAEVRIREFSFFRITADIVLYNEDGAVTGTLDGMIFRRLPRSSGVVQTPLQHLVRKREVVRIGESGAPRNLALRAKSALPSDGQSHGYIAILDEVVQTALQCFNDGQDLTPFQVAWQSAQRRHPQLSAELLLISACVGVLESSHSEVMMPQPGLPEDLWIRCFEQGASFQDAVQGLVATFGQIISKGGPDERLRVLECCEIGASLLPNLVSELPAIGVDYFVQSSNESIIDWVDVSYDDDPRIQTVPSSGEFAGRLPDDIDCVLAVRWPFMPEPAEDWLHALETVVRPGGIVLVFEPADSLWIELAASLQLGQSEVSSAWRTEGAVAADNGRWCLIERMPMSGGTIQAIERLDCASPTANDTIELDEFERVSLLVDGPFGNPFNASADSTSLVCLSDLETGSEIVSETMRRLIVPAEVNPETQEEWGETLFQLKEFLLRRLPSGIVGVVVTCGDQMRSRGFAGAVRGLLRVIANEVRQTQFAHIHVIDELADFQLVAHATTLAHPGDEIEIVDGVCSTTAFTHAASLVDTKNASLSFDRNQLDRPVWSSLDRRAPGDGEVEIRIAAAGVNFRDVMFAQGLLPPEILEGGLAGPAIGLEGVGEVVTKGNNVERLKVGDRAIFFGSPSFTQYLTLNADFAAKAPSQFEDAALAGLATVFMTAYYSLNRVARLEPGERVLIHGAAGGVGLAAIQYALHVGADVFATAGSSSRRDFLRRLGVRHVYGSRNFDFVDQLLADTEQQGVDVVLNSIAGEGVHQSLKLLRPFGRFVELGKRDFVGDTRMRLSPFRHNISYHGVDLDELALKKPKLTHSLLDEVMDLFEQRVFTPLPTRVFDHSRVTAAFRLLQESRHLGKIVLTPPNRSTDARPERFQPVVESSGLYVVTGGTSGFGFAAARWLARRGAGKIALLSRRGAAADVDGRMAAELRALGAEPIFAQADISSSCDTDRVFAEFASHGPVRGILHAATIYQDRPIEEMMPEDFSDAISAKGLGALNLLNTAASLSPDFVILFSSISTWVGNPNQANYSAANGMLDGLAESRSQTGLKVLSFGFSAIEDEGYLARNESVRTYLSDVVGITAIKADNALDQMWDALCRGDSVACSARADWQRIARVCPGLLTRRFQTLVPASASGELGDEDLLATVLALDEDEATGLLSGMLRNELSRILKIPAEKLSGNQTITQIGVDSLMAVELGMAIGDRLGIEVSSTMLSDSITIDRLAVAIHRQIAQARDTQVVAPNKTDEVLLNQHGISREGLADNT